VRTEAAKETAPNGSAQKELQGSLGLMIAELKRLLEMAPKELRRYEPRHLDAITEEAAHKQRMAAEQGRAVNYQPVGIAEFEVSVG